MLKIKRFKELVALFFQYVKQEGFSGTVKRATGFFRRRMKQKKGRFLPPQAELEKQGVKTELLGGLAIEPICKESSGKRIQQALAENKVVLIGGGTGNPYFTTDTASSLRAIEMKADVILKGTRVDGIYTSDPEKDPSATKYSTLTYEEALSKQLKIMDLTAFALCQENNMPIYVFDMNTEGNLQKVVEGEHIGTLVSKTE